jgi:hypothetical protein
MKRNTALFLLVLTIAACMLAGGIFVHTGSVDIPFLISRLDEENNCFNSSLAAISDDFLVHMDSLFEDMGIEKDGFLQTIYYIEMFMNLTARETPACVPLDTIINRGSSNTRSNVLATCALLQTSGWDVLCFYNDTECYLGLNLNEDWVVRRGNWVEKDGKKYYLKVFDLSTPVGSLLVDEPAAKYLSISSIRNDLRSIPCISSLPPFKGESLAMKLIWEYHDSIFTALALIPEEQMQLTQNLPPSLYGMAYSGMIEIQNAGLIEQLKAIVADMSEFEGVNCLYKFCQSEDIFIYDNTQPIKSVSHQLINGRNDCDGRSVVLYALLRTVMDYQKDDIVFLGWPNHIALGLKPSGAETYQRLFERNAFSIEEFFVLDAAYAGDTQWGDKMPRLSDTCEIIK